MTLTSSKQHAHLSFLCAVFPSKSFCFFFRLHKLWGLFSKKMFISEQTHESRRSKPVRATTSCLWQDTQPSRAPTLLIVRYPWQQWLDTWGPHTDVVRWKRIYPVAQTGLRPSRNLPVLTLPGTGKVFSCLNFKIFIFKIGNIGTVDFQILYQRPIELSKQHYHCYWTRTHVLLVLEAKLQ